MRTHDPRSVTVLLVEDNPGDVRLVQEALDGSALPVGLHVVGSGREALAFLRHEPPYDDAVRPDLVLLDLNLPGAPGQEVLDAIKSDPDLRTIPVCVLTSSTDPADVQGAYAARANAYVTKPMELDHYLDAIRQLERFWLSVATLPTHARGIPPRA